ncbi:MAG: glycine--tRNA ligase subunit beta, partial [Anaerolineae bacterium]|nr:glycine--tRNA ligase subunit beta [Anaerolineae bacterium]
MTEPLSFQQIIMRLLTFWAEYGCTLWHPYSEKVGAGTMNPATYLRVLGPEPWNVAYVEPSYRPDDGRFGDNPNRMQMHTQFQVILKPEPGNPQELYLESLYALGINRDEHDIRFVEDNWASPVLGAWGLGWEVWLDGLEIAQFTYFQQAGGFTVDPVAVELTYGLERITMFLQGVRSVWDIDWDGSHTYGDILLEPEIEHCRYDFELADVERLGQMYDTFEAEAKSCLAEGLVIPAHDYILRCSHTFNLLDTRGAIGVTERATYFRRMRDLSRKAAEAYVEQRSRMEYPWLRESEAVGTGQRPEAPACAHTNKAETLLLEIGTEELPATDVSSAVSQLERIIPDSLNQVRLSFSDMHVFGTPRRLVVVVDDLAPRQKSIEQTVRGPSAQVAFDATGNPTRAAQGFARKHGIQVEELQIQQVNGAEYVVVIKREEGQSAVDILPGLLKTAIAGLRFPKSMRWNQTGIAFSRPLRWLVALLGDSVVPFDYAGVSSGRVTRGSRPAGSPEIQIASADEHLPALAANRIVVDGSERQSIIVEEAQEIAQSVGGHIPDDPVLLDEVTSLVEQPTAFLGHFEEKYLSLPPEVLIAVMKKHQRYFPVLDDSDKLMPYFIAVRNGGQQNMKKVRRGNEEVIRARFSDANFFYREDTQHTLEDYLPRLATLTFQEQLGSMLDKSQRLEKLAPAVAAQMAATESEKAIVGRAAHLCKADLSTQMVVELTSLQGVMGREYALRSGESSDVAQTIFEHYLPRFNGDQMAQTRSGLIVGLANRLDSLVGLFAAGLQPTGSSDPYQLRRDALGIVQNLITQEIPFSVEWGLNAAARLLPIEASADSVAAALQFVIERLRGYLRDRGFSYDAVDAVLAARGDDPFRAYQAVEELTQWSARDD